jgi:hypothetical protein
VAPFKRYLLAVAGTLAIAWPIIVWGFYFTKILACNPSIVSGGTYVAFCSDMAAFGDFEHEALFYGMRGADRALTTSDVLFFGDSHLQEAFSHSNVNQFFETHRATFFLAGFGYGERYQFPLEVIRRHPPHPKIAVINMDPFFKRGHSGPARFIIDHPVSAWLDARFKSIVQFPYAVACRDRKIASLICGSSYILIRSERTGQWDWAGFNTPIPGPYPIASREISQARLRYWFTTAFNGASEFLSTLSAKCLVFTDVPYDGPVGTYVRRLAEPFNARLVLPQVEGLRTRDKRHLDVPSAIAWSNAFLSELEPIGRECGAW